MEKRKCSSKKHKDIDSIIYCQDCKLYMCNKCNQYHSEIFEAHNICDLNKENGEIFTGLCKEESHKINLQFYCKNHNSLCCAACISKIKGEGIGQHTDCDVCFIEEIKEQKNNILKENIKYLEECSNNIESLIKELKNIFEVISREKEQLKLKVQKIFTNIRNYLNEREDQLLLQIDEQYSKSYFKEDLIKISEKLPYEIKVSLEKGKIIEKEWNKQKLNSIINDCINIENNIKNIKIINESIEKFNNIKKNYFFFAEETEIKDYINKFGDIANEDEVVAKFKKIVKGSIEEYKNKNIKMKLIYDAERDGQNYSNCHLKCNKIPNTLSLVTTTKGHKFGFFRSKGINGSGPWLIDNTLFYVGNWIMHLSEYEFYLIITPKSLLSGL